MRKVLFGLAALPFLVGVASAAEPLSDLEMDQVTAGDSSSVVTPSVVTVTTKFTCPGCTSGQIFTLTSPQTFFSDLVQFLNDVGYKPQ
jgi:hypothetical protein